MTTTTEESKAAPIQIAGTGIDEAVRTATIHPQFRRSEGVTSRGVPSDAMLTKLAQFRIFLWNRSRVPWCPWSWDKIPLRRPESLSPGTVDGVHRISLTRRRQEAWIGKSE